MCRAGDLGQWGGSRAVPSVIRAFSEAVNAWVQGKPGEGAAGSVGRAGGPHAAATRTSELSSVHAECKGH